MEQHKNQIKVTIKINSVGSFHPIKKLKQQKNQIIKLTLEEITLPIL